MTTRPRRLQGATLTALLAAAVLSGCGATFGPTEKQLEIWAEAALESDPDVVAVAAYSSTASEALWYEINVYVTLREGQDVTYANIVNVYRALHNAPAGRWQGEEVTLKFLGADEDFIHFDAGATFDIAKPGGDPTGCVRSQWKDVVICLDSPQPVL